MIQPNQSNDLFADFEADPDEDAADKKVGREGKMQMQMVNEEQLEVEEVKELEVKEMKAKEVEAEAIDAKEIEAEETKAEEEKIRLFLSLIDQVRSGFPNHDLLLIDLPPIES